MIMLVIGSGLTQASPVTPAPYPSTTQVTIRNDMINRYEFEKNAYESWNFVHQASPHCNYNTLPPTPNQIILNKQNDQKNSRPQNENIFKVQVSMDSHMRAFEWLEENLVLKIFQFNSDDVSAMIEQVVADET